MTYETGLMVMAALVFVAIVFTLIGHSMATDECQRNIAESRKEFDNERKVLQSACRTALNQRDEAWEVAESVEKCCNDKHNKMVNCVIEGLRINMALEDEHFNDPMLALIDLIKSEHQAVLDVNSPEIKRIISKAKREHGKKVRKAADRKLEKSERAYDQRLIEKQNVSDMWKRAAEISNEQAHVLAQEFAMYRGIISQELDNYICLPSVRNACIKAINAQHQAYKDL